MKSRTRIELLVIGILCCVSLSRAATSEHRYASISTRNVFGLRPIPVEIAKTEPVAAPPKTEIWLTGITTLLGEPAVILEFTDPQTKKAERPPPFRVGDVYKDFTIVAIDVENQLVRAKQSGDELVLDFERNGIKAKATPIPSPAPAAPRIATASVTGRGISYGGEQQASPPATATMDPERAARLEEIRKRLEQQGDPRAKLIPPTGLPKSITR
jgi:hypothetical protein